MGKDDKQGPIVWQDCFDSRRQVNILNDAISRFASSGDEKIGKEGREWGKREKERDVDL
jgi:hypothetical protein